MGCDEYSTGNGVPSSVQKTSSATLEPMPANERRLVHIELRDHPSVRTESVGEGHAHPLADMIGDSGRARDVLDRVKREQSYKQIALALGVDERTARKVKRWAARALVEAASVIRGCARETDHVARQAVGFVNGPLSEYEDAYSIDACFGDHALEQTLAAMGQL